MVALKKVRFAGLTVTLEINVSEFTLIDWIGLPFFTETLVLEDKKALNKL